jgi:hypothetical protein
MTRLCGRTEVHEDPTEDRYAKQQQREQEAAEINVVPLPDAIVDKRTMMIIPKNAAIAISTMFSSGRLYHLAESTPSIASRLQ